MIAGIRVNIIGSGVVGKRAGCYGERQNGVTVRNSLTQVQPHGRYTPALNVPVRGVSFQRNTSDMKQLPGEVRTSTPFPAQVKRIPASITHGIPGVAIGVGVVALIVINHVAASVWNTLPDIFSIGLVAFGLIWAFAIVNDVMKNPEKYTKNEVTASEASVFGLVLAIMVAIIGFISFL